MRCSGSADGDLPGIWRKEPHIRSRLELLGMLGRQEPRIRETGKLWGSMNQGWGRLSGMYRNYRNLDLMGRGGDPNKVCCEPESTMRACQSAKPQTLKPKPSDFGFTWV